MDRPKLLDLFCGAGGAGYGLYLAGFDVTGVDVSAQPHYPQNESMRFIQDDAIAYALAHGWQYDAIWASPLCQIHSGMGRIHGSGYKDNHQDLIPHTRFALKALGLPYIIENVEGAKNALHSPGALCGCMFPELKVYRVRYFESNRYILFPYHRPHKDKTPSAGRGISPKGYLSITGTGGYGITDEQLDTLRKSGNPCAEWDRLRYGHLAMQCEWMARAELSQAIPPAFSEYLGKQLMQHVLHRREQSPEDANIWG